MSRRGDDASTGFGGFAIQQSGKQIGPALHVGYLPGRKSPCLYEIDGSVVRTFAYFRSHEDAVRAHRLLGHVTRTQRWAELWRVPSTSKEN